MSSYGISQTEPSNLLLIHSRILGRTLVGNHLIREQYYFSFVPRFQKRLQPETHFPLLKFEEYHHGTTRPYTQSRFPTAEQIFIILGDISFKSSCSSWKIRVFLCLPFATNEVFCTMLITVIRCADRESEKQIPMHSERKRTN